MSISTLTSPTERPPPRKIAGTAGPLLCLVLFWSCAGGARAAAPEAEAYAARDSRPSPVGEIARAESPRMIAYTVSVTITVKKVEAAFETLPGEVENQGGFIVQESSPSLTARIPAGNVDAFVGRLERLGRISSLRKSGSDITDHYRDDLVRLESLKAVRQRYLDLLGQASGVTEILAIEKELERVNTEIDVLEGRKRHAEQRVDYSQVTVHLQEKTTPGPLGWIFYGLFRGLRWLFVW